MIAYIYIETGYDSLSTGLSRQIILCWSTLLREKLSTSKIYIWELQGIYDLQDIYELHDIYELQAPR